MSHLKEHIIEKIKDGLIRPTPRWVFLLKSSVIWSLFAVSVILGSIAVSIIMFQISDADWAIYSKMNHNWIEFTLWSLPSFWIVLMILFLGLAYYDFRHTKKGYRYSVFSIFGLSIVTSILLGGGLYFGGFSEQIEEVLLSNIPQYNKLHYGKYVLWQKPEKGFLSGTVIRINNGFLTVHDLDSRDWEVDAEDSDLMPGFILRERAMIKMIGEFMDAGRFRARVISPYYKCHTAR